MAQQFGFAAGELQHGGEQVEPRAPDMRRAGFVHHLAVGVDVNLHGRALRKW
jgi:hypothetical protein